MTNELLKELGIEGVAELIAERFDDAIDLMHSDAIVYGGAIRDVLAGLSLEGDLDIATDGYSYRDTSRNFRRSPKWTEKGRAWRPLSIATATKSGRTTSNKPSSFRRPPSSNPYEDANMPVADTMSFVTFNSARAQIVMAKNQSKDSFDGALEIVKHVDFVCCGLMMDNTGRVFEVIEGAYEDCKNKVLRLNKDTKNINIDSLKERVAKLKKRGWESKINISAVKRKMQRAHKAKIAKQQKQMEAQQKQRKPSFNKLTQPCTYITIKESKAGPFRDYSIAFNRKKYERAFNASKSGFIGLTPILDTISSTARNAGIEVAHKPGSEGIIKIDIMTKKIKSDRVHDYAGELQDTFERMAFEFNGKPPKKRIKRNIKKSAYDAFAVSKFSDKHTNLSAKLRGRPIGEEMAVARKHSELVHPAGLSGVETMSFKATMAPDGQIMINPVENDGPIEVGVPNSPDEGVTIDVSDLPPEAAQQLRSALENVESENMTTSEVDLRDPEAEPEDMTAPEEVPARKHYARAHGEMVPDHEVQEMGRASDEDAYAYSNKFHEIGEDPDDRDRDR